MKIDNRTFQFLLLPCLLTFVFIACRGGSTSTTRPKLAPTIEQGISGQQLLRTPVTYVALGASDAVGVGSKQPGSQGYVPLLAAHLQKGSHLINLGISGIHLHDALSQELPLALNTSPKLITIWLVTNDFMGGVPYSDYMHDLDTLLRQLRTGTVARIVMANLPDLTRLPLFKGQSAERKARMLADIKLWNKTIATTESHYGVTLVDLFSHESQLTNHPEYISNDGFHPSPAGYVELSKYFWDALQVKGK